MPTCCTHFKSDGDGVLTEQSASDGVQLMGDEALSCPRPNRGRRDSGFSS